MNKETRKLFVEDWLFEIDGFENLDDVMKHRIIQTACRLVEIAETRTEYTVKSEINSTCQ